jgi:hypothetical protein
LINFQPEFYNFARTMGDTNKNTPPAWDSPALALRPSSDDERVIQWSLCAKTWGSGDIEEFVEGERRLATQLGIETGGIRHWILVDTAEHIQPGQQRTILSSLENLRRRAVYSYDDNGQRKVEDTTCYGVAAVHCPKDNRGRGYARRMVTEIGRLLRADIPNFGLEKCLFSVLYSGVGVVRSCLHFS